MTVRLAPDTQHLRVLIADEDESTLERLRAVLEDDLGHEVTPFAVSVAEAIELISREDPDLAIVMVHQDDDHALTLISEAVEYASGPVIAHVAGHNGVEFVRRAAERGVSAYVDSAEPSSVQAAIEVAMHRHAEVQQLEEKVGQLETALERRTIIERAKGILMERHGIAERESFERLRDHARSESKRVVEVAEAVIAGHALLPPR